MSPLGTNNTIRDAALLFRDIILRKPYSNMPVLEFADEDPPLTPSIMIADQAWLPGMMMMSDEISIILFGRQCWNAIYEHDTFSICGLAAIDDDDITDDVPDEILLTYQRYRDELLTPENRMMICNLAVDKMVRVEKNGCYLKQPTALRWWDHVNDGDILPMRDPEDLAYKMFCEDFSDVADHVRDAVVSMFDHGGQHG